MRRLSNTIKAIAAVDEAGGLSKNGEIPWYFPEDFNWFKEQTKNCIGLMGRGTYEDICARLGNKAEKSVLPGRDIFVLSSTMNPVDNATVVRSIDEFVTKVQTANVDMNKPIMILGGQEIYNMCIPYCHYVLITRIPDRYDCDKFFPTNQLEHNNFKLIDSRLSTEFKLKFEIWKA